MPGFTLKCGHRFDHHDLHLRAMSIDVSRARCPVCKEGFTSQECTYLDLIDPTETTFEEWVRSEEERLAKRSAELAANPPPKLMGVCSGICKSGKTCTKTAMRSNGVFCNLHVPK